MYEENSMRIAVRRSHGNVVGFSIRKCRRALQAWEIFLYGKHARDIACICIRVYARACIHRDFRDDFSTDLSTAMAQMHVTPYVPFATSRRTMPYRCRLFPLRVGRAEIGRHCHQCAISFLKFLLKKSHDAFAVRTIREIFYNFLPNFTWR